MSGSRRDHFSHFVSRRWHIDDPSGLGRCYLVPSSKQACKKNHLILPASYSDVSLSMKMCAQRKPSVPFPWSLAVHHQSLAFRAPIYDAKNETPDEEAVILLFLNCFKLSFNFVSANNFNNTSLNLLEKEDRGNHLSLCQHLRCVVRRRRLSLFFRIF